MPNKSKAPTASQTVKIAAGELIVTPAELDALNTYLAAHRAARLANGLLQQLKPTVLRLAKKYPGLQQDGALITTSHQTSWSFPSPKIKDLAMQMWHAEHLARVAYADGTDKTSAIPRTTTFPVIRETNPAYKLKYPTAGIHALRESFTGA